MLIDVSCWGSRHLDLDFLSVIVFGSRNKRWTQKDEEACFVIRALHRSNKDALQGPLAIVGWLAQTSGQKFFSNMES